MSNEAVSLSQIPRSLVLQPISRRPTILPPETVALALTLEPPFVSESQPVQTSIIIITFNSEAFTRLCLASLMANTDSSDYEIIIVDNGSTDRTPEFLQTLAEKHSHIRVIFNSTNRGFAAANNQGLAIARGKILVLLNNDTLVPANWLAGLKSHLQSPEIGMVGPVTNRVQNEAKIQTTYYTYGEFLDFAQIQLQTFHGQSFDVTMLIMFAVAMRREVFESVGPLDENFGAGMFEDDDYAMRVRAKGHRLICARDTFVHHFGQASFGALTPSGEFNRIFDRNRRYFEQKWNCTWKPHQPGEHSSYHQLTNAVTALIPERARLAVISNADEGLLNALQYNDRIASHFPHQADGSPIAHHPRDGREALSLLREDQATGVRYLVIPKPYLWWLDFYTEIAVELRQCCRRLEPHDGCCVIFDLSTLPTQVINR